MSADTVKTRPDLGAIKLRQAYYWSKSKFTLYISCKKVRLR